MNSRHRRSWIAGRCGKRIDYESGGKEYGAAAENGKTQFKAVWIGILGICAAPIALPIALSLICVIAAVIVSVFCVFAGLFLTAVTLAGAAVIGVIGGAALLIQSLPDGLATLGFSLCCGAVGIMSVYGIFCFLKWLLYKVAQLLGKIMKGGKKNEK